MCSPSPSHATSPSSPPPHPRPPQVEECLIAWFKANKTPNCPNPRPERVIFYRDGVAHNMFEKVIAVEIRLLKQGFAKHGLYPEIIFIVVQQRTKARFFTLNEQNVPPGTVIDCDVVEANSYDWYMVPHHGLKGVCCPTHYHVLRDDSRGSVDPDQLQYFTYQLCYLFARATKVVSKPAPVYYAHVAAFKAQYNTRGYREVGDSWETGSTTSAGSGDGFIQVHPHIRSTVYYA